MKKNVFARIPVFALAGAGLLYAATISRPALADTGGQGSHSFAYSPNAKPRGLSQRAWQAKWWQWALAQPVGDHPFIDTPNFDVSAGQTDSVWFLAGVAVYDSSESVTRSCTIPEGTSLFVALANSEWSSLEGFTTEQEQRDLAAWYADHIVPSSLSCTLDGQALTNVLAYRMSTPQFTFDAPSPWIFGATGGTGTAVSEGYHVFLKELNEGQHTLHFTAHFRFTLADDGFDFDAYINQTYSINQLGEDEG